LDRLDLLIELPAAPADWLDAAPGESSAAVRERVAQCRERQQRRQGAPNAMLQGRAIDAGCPLEPDVRKLLQQAIQRMHGLADACELVLGGARTVVELDVSERILPRHVAEAVK